MTNLIAATFFATAAAGPQGRSRPECCEGIDTDLKVLAAQPGTRRSERARLRADILRRASPLARHIASCYCGFGENYDDLYRVTFLGLVDAVDTFAPGRDGPFLPFAVPIMMGELRRYLRDRSWSTRVPQRVEEIRRRFGPAIETLHRRLSRMPTASEIADELDIEVAEVTHALITDRFGTIQREDLS